VTARRRLLLGLLAVAAAAAVTAAGAPADTSVKDYVAPVGGAYAVDALFSANDKVPEASNPGLFYRMVGIPDGLGAMPNGDGTSTLYMNHELGFAATSSPVVDGAGNPVGPAYRGAVVSKWTLDANGNPIKGERAYDTIWEENTLLGPAPDASNVAQMPRQFGRFCSGGLHGQSDGYDRPIYFANEEVGAAESFDGKGGIAVAVFDNQLHTLPKLGRFSWEQTVTQPNKIPRTVIIGTEDGPAALDPAVSNSQIYMYVGKKQTAPGSSVLRRNGLDNGDLFVLAPVNPAQSSEAVLTSGSIAIRWVKIPNAGALTDVELEAASDAAAAFTFARPEDAAFNKRDKNEVFFVTTGDAAVPSNTLGRLYSLQLNSGDPTGTGTLTVAYNAQDVLAAGGDIAISPDNIDTSTQYLMINEDGTGASRPVMASKGRDGSIWRFNIVTKRKPDRPIGVRADTATRVAELDPPGRDGVAVGAGIWETSGIIDASDLFGANWWLSDVQAHPPTAAPAAGTVEDGQLFLLKPAS
jgi:Alkaline phosphatase PhoX